MGGNRPHRRARGGDRVRPPAEQPTRRSRGDGSPLVSVVVPTYNRPKLLASAVGSVADQTYGRLEVLIVDDGSDTSVDAALEGLSLPRGATMRVLRHDENRGANPARNTGIAAATGSFVAFLDDDDLWRPGKIERQLRALRDASDDVGVAFTGQVQVDATGAVTNVVRPTTTGDFTKKLVQGAPFGTFSTVMVRADVFDETGYLDPKLPCWQDREWYFRLAATAEYVSILDPLCVRRITDCPQISDDYPAKRDVAYPRIREKHRRRAAELGPAYERLFVAVLTRSVAKSAMDHGRYAEAMRYLARSLAYRPTDPETYAYVSVVLGGKYTHGLARACKRAVNRWLIARLDGYSSPRSCRSTRES